MGTKMGKKMERVAAWLEAGMPDDDESLAEYGITVKVMKKLEKRVFAAIHEKMTATPGKITFAEHRTLQ